MNRSDLENGMNELEGRDTDDVSNLLGALPRVEAPANFEFGVKARIAAGDVSPRASLVPFLKLAAPLSLVLLVAAFVIFYGTLPAAQDTVIADETNAPVNNAIPRPDPTFSAQEPATVSGPQAPELAHAASGITQPPRSSISGPVRRASRSESTPERRKGSLVISQRTAKVITAPGFESVTNPNRDVNAPNVDAGREIPIREVLEMLGVKADFANGGWKVRSTADNSVAARAGVRLNDVIEAFNDHDLTEVTTLKAGFAAKSLRVRRDGTQVKLDLKN